MPGISECTSSAELVQPGECPLDRPALAARADPMGHTPASDDQRRFSEAAAFNVVLDPASEASGRAIDARRQTDPPNQRTVTHP